MARVASAQAARGTPRAMPTLAEGPRAGCAVPVGDFEAGDPVVVPFVVDDAIDAVGAAPGPAVLDAPPSDVKVTG